MYESNPRFPHTLVVKRVRKTDGEIVFDANGNPTYDVLSLSVVAMSNGAMLRDSDGAPIVASTATSIPCGYRQSTRGASEDGDVVMYNVALHTPAFITELLYDDVLQITDYDRTYSARLVKKITTNFGTSIWFDEIKN